MIQRTSLQKLGSWAKGRARCRLLQAANPFFCDVPGIIAFHIYGDSLGTMDAAYRTRERGVTQLLDRTFSSGSSWYCFSSFNSLLQFATIVSLDLYKPEKESYVTDRDRIKAGQYTGLAVMLLGICIAPLLLDAPEALGKSSENLAAFTTYPL